MFTRRIVAPEAGARLTTKAGPYAVGALVARDEVSRDTSSAAHFAIARVTRDLFRQGSIGALATVRDDAGSRNAVAALDGRLKFGQNWTALWQIAGSESKRSDRTASGSAWSGQIARTGRQFLYTFNASGLSPEFAADAGYVPRVDARRLKQDVSFRFRPEGRVLLAWGPTSMLDVMWDYAGTRLEWWRKHFLELQLRRQLELTGTIRPGRHLVVQTAYLFTELDERSTGAPVLANHVSRWQLQFTREWSLRTIVRYDRTRAAAARTALSDDGNLNADVLLTWMMNPWTAVYAGYNGNGAEEYDPIGRAAPRWRRNTEQIFVKVSYLWRP